MDTEKFVVAIRTYDRPQAFLNKTYALLKRTNLLDRTYIFVANQKEYDRYKEVLTDFDCSRLIIGELGSKQIFDYMIKFFPLRQKIMFFDDDLIDVKFWNPETNRFFNDDTKLKGVIEECFTLIDTHNLGSFTFHIHFTSPNGLTARGSPRLSFKNNFLHGGFFGCRNEPELIATDFAHDDDGMRTINFYEKYGGVLKCHYVSIKTPVIGTNEGGYQSSGNRKDTKKVAEDFFNNPKYNPWLMKVRYVEEYKIYSVKLKIKPGIIKVLQSRNIPIRFQDFL
jgi:hypothetical protein